MGQWLLQAGGDTSRGGGRLARSSAAAPTPELLPPTAASEETLLREIENRYPAPDAISPRHIGESPSASSCDAGAGAAPAAAATGPGLSAFQHHPAAGPAAAVDTVDFQPALAVAAQSLTPVDSMESAEK